MPPDSITARAPESPDTPPSWFVTFVLALLLGTFGAHRFYTRKTVSGNIALLLSLAGWGIFFTAVTLIRGSSQKGFVLTALALCGLTTIWALMDVFLLLLGKYRDGEGQEVSREPGEGLDVIVGIILALCLSLLAGLAIHQSLLHLQAFPHSLTRQEHLSLLTFYRAGGFFMNLIALFSLPLPLLVGFLLPYGFRHKRLPVHFATLTVLFISLTLIFGAVVTFFGIQEALVVIDHTHNEFSVSSVFARYIDYALITESLTGFALAGILPLGALALACLPNAARASVRGWRVGCGAAYIALFVIGAYIVAGESFYKSPGLLLQGIATLLCLGALVIGLVRSSDASARHDSLDTKTRHHNSRSSARHDSSGARALLLCVMALLGIAAAGVAVDTFYTALQCRLLGGAGMEQAFHAMVRRLAAKSDNFATPDKLMRLGLASAAIPALWILWRAVQSAKKARHKHRILAPILVLLLGLSAAFCLRSYNINLIVAVPTRLLQRATAERDFTRAYKKVPLTARLARQRNQNKDRPKPAQSIPKLIGLSASYAIPYWTDFHTNLKAKGIYVGLHRWSQLSLNAGMRIPPAARKENPFLPPSLHRAYKQRAEIYRKLPRRSRIGLHRKTSFHVHPAMPFATLAASLYSAHKSGFSRLFLLFPRRGSAETPRGRINITLRPMRFPVSLALWPGKSGSTDAHTQAPESFRLVLRIDGTGAVLRSRKPDPGTSSSDSQASNKHTKAKKSARRKPRAKEARPTRWQETTLWREARSGKKGLQFRGLQERLRSYWNTHKSREHHEKRLLVHIGLRRPYHELLGALDATGLTQEGQLWLAPHSRGARRFWLR